MELLFIIGYFIIGVLIAKYFKKWLRRNLITDNFTVIGAWPFIILFLGLAQVGSKINDFIGSDDE